MSIVVQDICFSYGKNCVLDTVRMAFESGTFSAIVGPNGCGKSTLFGVMSRTHKPTSGQVLLNGVDIYDMSPREQAQRMAVLSQIGTIPEFMTVHDMVLQGRFCYQSFLSRYSDTDLKIVATAMEKMDIVALADRKVSELSGGQIQRCRMAMTLAQDTDIILLDEPTTHLDLKHQYALLDMGRDLANAGKTVIAILHDITHAELYADRVAVLHNTQVYNMGTPSTVITTQMMQDVFAVDTVRIGNNKAGFYVPKHLVR